MQDSIVFKSGNPADQNVGNRTAVGRLCKFFRSGRTGDNDDARDRPVQHPDLCRIYDVIIVLVKRSYCEDMVVAEMTFDVDDDFSREIIRLARIQLRIEKDDFRNVAFGFQLARAGGIAVFPRRFQNPFPGFRTDPPVARERARDRRDGYSGLLRKFLYGDPVSHLFPFLFRHNVAAETEISRKGKRK